MSNEKQKGGNLLSFNMKTAAPFIALLALILIGSLVHPNFLTYDNLIQNVATRTSFIAIIAIGATFVMAAGGLDLSVGSIAAFVAGVMLIYLKSVEPDVGIATLGMAMGLAILIGAVCGFANGAITTIGKIEPFIVTLGTMVILRSLFTFLANGGSISISPATKDLYGPVYKSAILGVPIPLLAVLFVALCAAFLLYKTSFGRHVIAVGSNEDVARYSGINVNRVKLLTYVIQGICVGIAIILYVPRLGSANSATGLFWELQAITAVVIGGTLLRGGAGRIWGTLAGAFFLEIIGNILTLSNVNVYLIGAVQGAIIIIAMLVQRSLSRRG
jgi:ribose transport system permease protein